MAPPLNSVMEVLRAVKKTAPREVGHNCRSLQLSRSGYQSFMVVWWCSLTVLMEMVMLLCTLTSLKLGPGHTLVTSLVPVPMPHVSPPQPMDRCLLWVETHRTCTILIKFSKQHYVKVYIHSIFISFIVIILLCTCTSIHFHLGVM